MMTTNKLNIFNFLHNHHLDELAVVQICSGVSVLL